MLSDSEQSGLFTLMICLIAVVFAGVGLSMLVDRRFSFSSSEVQTEAKVEAGAAELESLIARRDAVARRFADTEPVRRAEFRELETVRATMKGRDLELERLGVFRRDLEQSVAKLEREFAEYREKYRAAARRAGEGRLLGDLKVRGGRVYQHAVIRKVTEVGLEISHEHGLARIQAPDLDSTLQDEFQWDDEERRERLKQELANRRMVGGKVRATAPVVVPSAAPRQRSEAEADYEKIEELRNRVRAWKVRIAQLSAERGTSYSGSAYGTRSVPGKLETYEAKNARLDSQLATARAELAVAKSFLARVSPGDPLLRPEPQP